MLAAIAVSPLFVWQLAEFYLARQERYAGIWYEYPGEIALAYVQYIVHLLISIIGTVVVATGVAFVRQRGVFGPFSFVVTSLAVAALLTLLDVTLTGLAYLYAKHASSDPSLTGAEAWLTGAFLSNTGTVVGIGLASSLYARWRRPTPDPRDTRRMLSLAATAAIVAIWTVAIHIEPMWREAGSVPIGVLWSVRYLVEEAVRASGTLFLFGSAAILILRRARREDQPIWILVAGLTAALTYWLITYSPASLKSWLDDYGYALAATIAVGFGGSVLYMCAVDSALLQRWLSALRGLADVPATIRRLRTWPHRPSEDEDA